MLKEKGYNISRRQVSDWLKTQEISQLYAPTQKRKTIKVTVIKKPYGQVGIDLADMQNFEYSGFKYIFTAIDQHSKRAWAKPLKNKEEKTVVTALKALLRAPGFNNLKSIRSDNGSEFINSSFENVLKEKRIKQTFSTPGLPASNGLIERFNRTLKGLVRKFIASTDNQNWPPIIPQLIKNYNSTIQSTIGKSPDQASNPSNQAELKDTENRIRKKVSQRISKGEPKFMVNDFVRIKESSEERTRLGYTYTREIYQIAKVFIPRQTTTAPKLSCENFARRVDSTEIL